MAMVTRTVKTFKAQAWAIDWVDGEPVAELIGECRFVGGHPSKTDARNALKDAGIEVKRGTEIKIDEVSSVLYGMDQETFMQYAKPIE